MKNKSLTLKVKSEDVEIIREEDSVTIHIKNDVALNIIMDGGGMIHSKDDFFIAAEGELGLMSFGKPLTIDSVDSVIHQNYRESKLLKDLPESIEFRKRCDEENQKCITFAVDQEGFNRLLKDRVTILEQQMSKLLGE
jgi:hypothetical protein